MASKSFANMIEFMSLVGQLKHVKRTGWVRKKVQDPESVAGHMYRMAVLSLCFSSSAGVDKDKCLKLSLVHDLAESIVGDIAPSDGVSKQEKQKREEAAMKYICRLVNPDLGTELYSIWEEYENQTSKEAEFVKDLDRFEMILQAHEYEQDDQQKVNLQEFFDSTRGKFQTKTVDEWSKGLEEIRNSCKIACKEDPTS
ncbi:5'-deoxynucleotidase HDDC2-like [Liolophura sinensis]|uniref:5'-deoxynucleotidase HDDC2-like n=1 Tax=Liolophura sinensis TaxID=3198878 RepID=UPI003159481A